MPRHSHTLSLSHRMVTLMSLSSSTLTVDALASLAATLDARSAARVTDTQARALARAIRDTRKAETQAETLQRLESAKFYTPEDDARIASLIPLWTRSKAIRAAMSAADKASRETTVPAERYDAVYRASRLQALLARVDAATARMGAFPLSARDADPRTSRFIGTAARKRYTFKGGRDVIGATVYDLQDIFQIAAERAISAGEHTNGIPHYGSFFRHVNSARAHVTNIAGAEWRGIVGWINGDKGAELAYPLADDKHAMRKLGTVAPNGTPYGTRDTHALAMLDEQRAIDAEFANARVDHEARTFALIGADNAQFATQLARVILDGATVADIVAGLNLSLDTIKRNLSASPRIVSGLNHELAQPDIDGDYATITEHAHSARLGYVTARYADAKRNGYFASPEVVRARRAALMPGVPATIDSGKPARADVPLSIARTLPTERVARLNRLESLIVRRNARRAGHPELGASFI